MKQAKRFSVDLEIEFEDEFIQITVSYPENYPEEWELDFVDCEQCKELDFDFDGFEARLRESKHKEIVNAIVNFKPFDDF